LTQHEVARGSQPWFYYFLLAILYEPLPLAAGAIALVAGATRLRRPSWDPAAGDLTPAGEPAGREALAPAAAIGRSDRRSFLSFLLWWTLATWCAYTFAGEKMPWLVTHLVLPLAILAGWGMARLLLAARARTPGSSSTALVLVGGAWVGPVLAIQWLAAHPFSGDTTEAVADTMKWVVRSAVIAILIAFMARAAWRVGARQAGRLVTLGVAALLSMLGIRAGMRLCFRNFDLATEHLSYAQGTPDVKRAMREIELISERSAGDRELVVAYDDQSSWPFVWYLRDYPKSRTWGTQPTFAQGAVVVITGPKNRDAVWPVVASGFVKREYRLIWWPRQDYASMGPRGFWQLLRDPERRAKLWRMAMDHDYSHLDAVKWDPRQEFDMYVRDDVAPLGLAALGLGESGGGASGTGAVPAASGARLQPQPSAILAGPYDGSSMAQPTDVAVASDGARVVADAGNHRLLVLERDGTLRQAFGSKCDLGQGEAAGCVDPDGAGPLEFGDGQFNDPWGVAVGPSGEIFVSDTWNHRIQRFSADGRFLGKWGHFGNAPIAGTPPVDETVFYGPRGITLGLEDDLVVADTGNKRLLSFSFTGEQLRVLGSGGPGPDQFDEPVGVETDADGTLVVADAWNQRVKRLDRRYASIANWRVPDWQSEAVWDKPFLAVDESGLVYAGDPAGGRVWIFEPSGRLTATLVLPALENGTPRPIGIAIDRGASELLVVDQTGGRILVFELPVIEESRLPS
jgi:sugar lactone lactonase YvrE